MVESLMDAIRLSVDIGEDRRLVIDLPADTPIGQAELIIKPYEEPKIQTTNPAREVARAKLAAAGALSTTHHVTEDAPMLTPKEQQRVWEQFSQGRTSDEIINEERGSY
jgi:hypothetical protein